MRCPACGSDEVEVYGTERLDADLVSPGLVRRWRRCMTCGAAWRTFEEWDGRGYWYCERVKRAADSNPDQG